MKKVFRWFRFFMLASLILLVPLTLQHIWDLDLLVGVTGMTALILLWYTIETQGMRLEVVRQNEIAILPLVILSIELRPVEGRSTSTSRPRRSGGSSEHRAWAGITRPGQRY